MKNKTLNDTIKSTLTVITGVILFLTLSIDFVAMESLVGNYSQNGFDMLVFSDGMVYAQYRWISILVGILCWLQMIFSFLTVVVGLISFVSVSDLGGKLCSLVIKISLGFFALYFIEGFFYVILANQANQASLQSNVFMSLFWGIILLIAYFFCENFLFKKPGKSILDRIALPKVSNVSDEAKKAEVLAKYKKLLDDGAITLEEYEKIKNSIIK